MQPIVSHVLVLVAGVAAGYASYAARQPSAQSELTPGERDMVTAVSAAPRQAADGARPMLVVLSNGEVTGHFDRVSPRWLLAALESAGISRTSSSEASSLHAVADDTAPAPVAATDVLLLQLRQGTELERYAALTQALQAGIDLPAQDLVDAFESGLSDRLALLAFGAFVDTNADDAGRIRAALVRGGNSNSAAVREEASRRMLELDRLEQTVAAIDAQGLQ